MMRRTLIILIFITIYLAQASALGATYNSASYTLQSARIVVSGGGASSASFTLKSVRVGGLFGGKASSSSYSLDASKPDRPNDAPNPPTLNPITSPTNVSSQILSGQKEPFTSIYINGYEALPLNNEIIWSHTRTLTEGENHLLITARNVLGLDSAPVYANIILDTIPPSIIITTPATSPILYTDRISIEGTKDGIPFVEEKLLDYGLNTLLVEAYDAAGNVSSRTVEAYRLKEPPQLP